MPQGFLENKDAIRPEVWDEIKARYVEAAEYLQKAADACDALIPLLMEIHWPQVFIDASHADSVSYGARAASLRVMPTIIDIGRSAHERRLAQLKREGG